MGAYKLSKAAEADLIRIHHYGVRNYGEVQAERYFRTFFDRFEELATQPYLYPAVDYIREGYRRSVCGKDNIYYRITGDNIEIMAIIGRQNPKELT